MDQCFINGTTLTNIGDAIRRKTGGTELMLPSAMPGVIDTLNSGLYAWRKYIESNRVITDFTFDLVPYTSYKIWTVTADAFDATKVDASFFDGVVINGSYTLSWDGSQLLFDNSIVMTYDQTTRRLTAESSISSLGTNNATCTYTGSKVVPYDDIVKNFIDFVVSNQSGTFPDDGELDGYMYEKISDIISAAKVEVGTVILTSSSSTLTINHSLGEIPDFVLVYCSSRVSSSYTQGATTFIGITTKGELLKKTTAYDYNNTIGKTQDFDTLTEDTIGIPCYSKQSSFGSSDWGAYTYKWVAVKLDGGL